MNTRYFAIAASLFLSITTVYGDPVSPSTSTALTPVLPQAVSQSAEMGTTTSPAPAQMPLNADKSRAPQVITGTNATGDQQITIVNPNGGLQADTKAPPPSGESSANVPPAGQSNTNTVTQGAPPLPAVPESQSNASTMTPGATTVATPMSPQSEHTVTS